MAPRKRRASTEEVAKPEAAGVVGRRVTRSMSRPAVEGSLAPAKKKGKGKAERRAETKTAKKEAATAAVAAEEKAEKEESFFEEDKTVPAVPAGNSDGIVRLKKEGERGEVVDDESKSGKGGSVTVPCIVVIEHCQQCNSFKTRALKVKEGLEKGVSGITVLINPEKPRKGCFEIREKDGKKFISLLDMKRPFKPMKDLNMEEVIANIISKLSA